MDGADSTAKPKTRLFAPDDLTPGASVALSADQRHFLRSVLRLRPGDAVALFNGRDGEVWAEVEELGKARAVLRIRAMRRPFAAPPEIHLLFAPIKKSALDFLIQKGTELGVTDFRPILTRRTQSDRVRVDRLSATATEAAEQCERLERPTVHDPMSLESALQAWPDERPLLVCAEAGEARPLGAVAARLDASNGVGFLIGPEGGFADAELQRLADAPFCQSVGLGPRILRAETAAAAALAIWQSVAGDGGDRPPDR